MDDRRHLGRQGQPLPEDLRTNGERGSLDKFAQWGSGKTLRQLVVDVGGLADSVDLVGTSPWPSP